MGGVRNKCIDRTVVCGDDGQVRSDRAINRIQGRDQRLSCAVRPQGKVKVAPSTVKFEKTAVAPLGNPEGGRKLTAPLKPPLRVTDMANEPDAPWEMVCDAGLADMLKSPDAAAWIIPPKLGLPSTGMILMAKFVSPRGARSGLASTE